MCFTFLGLNILIARNHNTEILLDNLEVLEKKLARITLESLVSPPQMPAKCFEDLGIDVISFVKERDVCSEWQEIHDAITAPADHYDTEEHMNVAMHFIFSTLLTNLVHAKVVVNSEFCPWLPYDSSSEGSTGKGKPDFWFGCCSIVERKPKPSNK